MRFLLLICAAGVLSVDARMSREEAALWIDFETFSPKLELYGGPKRVEAPVALEFDSILQWTELPFARQLDGISEMTIGGWFFVKRAGEQYFFSRGMPGTAPGGERVFRREESWVNFVLGTDQRGFLLGTINGNGTMPFPHVTIEEIGIGAWHQLAVSKDSFGIHRFYHNGVLVHSDQNAVSGGRIHSFNDKTDGAPVRLMMPLGGRIGEVWVFKRALSPQELAQDFEAKRDLYKPALPSRRPLLREMNAHFSADLWKTNVTREDWSRIRAEILREAMSILGAPPDTKVPLEPIVISEEDLGTYVRRKVSIQVHANDRMPFWMLIPKHRAGSKSPAIICFYGTSGGTGKDSVVGLTGREPGSKPHPNMSFALDIVRAGFVAVAADYLRDGERIRPGRRPYDTTDFYDEFPAWSIHGKDLWDTQRLIDYLETLTFIQSDRIGMTGHSYGGHSTIFCAAMEPRVQVAVANGPVSDFLHHGLHWGVPRGAGNSQSMPALRPYVLDHTIPLPITFYQFTALIAPRPLLVGQAAGERRPMEEENYAAMKKVYDALGVPSQVRYHWYAGDHDFPPEARAAMVDWFRRWLN